MEKVTILSLSVLPFFLQVTLSLKRRGRLSSGRSVPVMNVLCPGHPFGFSPLGSAMTANALLTLSLKCSGICHIFHDNFGNIAM